MENYRRGIYSGLVLSGELKKHLHMVQEQILWVRKMNNIQERAEEIAREVMIYFSYRIDIYRVFLNYIFSFL